MDPIDHISESEAGAKPLSSLGRKVAMVQAVYFLITGIWPLISIRTFQKLTGPKTDLWLVQTVGVLVGVIGVVLGLAGLRGRATDGERILAVGSAAGLAAIDVLYVLRGRILPVYLLDALLELAIIGGWLVEQKQADSDAGAAPAASEHPVGQGYYMAGYPQRSRH